MNLIDVKATHLFFFFYYIQRQNETTLFILACECRTCAFVCVLLSVCHCVQNMNMECYIGKH